MNNQQSIWMTTSMITSTNSLFICLHTTCFWRAAPKNSQSGQNFEMLVLVDRGKERGKAKRFLFVHFSRLPYELRQRRFEVTDQRGLKKKRCTLFECQCIQQESTNWGNYFYVSGDCHFTWSSEPREGLAICRAKNVPSFLCYFKTLSVGSAPEIEPSTSRSAVKRSTD